MTLKESLQLLKINRKITFSLLTALLVILVSTWYLLGFSIGKSHSQDSITLINDQACSKNTVELKNELRLCLSNQASMTAPQDDGIYDFSTFKVYSPLLQGKQVSKTEFEYKRALITYRGITVDENAGVQVWVLEKPSQYLPPLPERLSKKTNPLDLTYSLYDFPIFDGYEWANIVVDEKFLSSRLPESPTMGNTYISKKGIKMYRKTQYCPKSACTTELYFYTTTDQGKTQVFVQIESHISGYLEETSEQLISKRIREAFNNAELIANTLSLEKY